MFIPVGQLFISGCLENKACLAKSFSSSSVILMIFSIKLVMIQSIKEDLFYSCEFSSADNMGTQRTLRVVSLLSAIIRLSQGQRYGGTRIHLLAKHANGLR